MFSKKSNKNNIIYFKFKIITLSLLLFGVYFFTNSLIYAQTEKASANDYLIPSGKILQIDAELRNLIVRNICDNSPFVVGDYIEQVNDVNINSYSDFSKLLLSLPYEQKIPVVINRGDRSLTISTTRDILEKISFNNIISGFATLTYINPETMEFGAVAHPINIGGSKKVPIKNGTISTTTSLNIEKSYRGSVGSISATKKDTIGQFNLNTSYGIKGTISNYNLSDLKKYKVASLDEVKLGKAQIILQSNNEECKKYDIEIISIDNQKSPSAKTFKIRILDKDLMLKTGGIVQGMSGTPIVQGDKIIGAVSHAVENDPSLGYGVFIKWMLENDK